MASIAPIKTVALRCARTLSTTPNVVSKASKHRPVMPFEGQYPVVAPDAFVAPSATVVGNVELHYNTSVWYNAVIRGDQNKVIIGDSSIIGDRVSISTLPSLDSGFPALCEIEQNVEVGSGTTMRSCIILNGAKIGENCVICEGAIIEAGAHVGDGSVVPPGRLIPAGQYWSGNPVVYVGEANHNDNEEGDYAEINTCYDHEKHASEFSPYNTVFWNDSSRNA